MPGTRAFRERARRVITYRHWYEELVAPSGRLRHHGDGAARAFLRAHSAAFTIIVIELEAPAGAELDHRVVGADAVAIVAFEAIAARETAPGLVERIGLVEPVLHLLERRRAAREL